MTKIIFNVKEDGEIFFECENHSGDHDVCGTVTAYCNVLVKATERAGYEVDIYEYGHVRIYIPKVEKHTIEVFESVMAAFIELSEDEPDRVKIY